MIAKVLALAAVLVLAARHRQLSRTSGLALLAGYPVFVAVAIL